MMTKTRKVEEAVERERKMRQLALSEGYRAKLTLVASNVFAGLTLLAEKQEFELDDEKPSLAKRALAAAEELLEEAEKRSVPQWVLDKADEDLFFGEA